MTDLETRLAEARERYGVSRLARAGFDVAANIAREVVAEKDDEIAKAWAENREMVGLLAEKDAEIARLRADLKFLHAECLCGAVTELDEKPYLAEPRKVSDAQREAIGDVFRSALRDVDGVPANYDGLCTLYAERVCEIIQSAEVMA